MSKNLCDCPYVDWCQTGRQELQESFRKRDESYKVKDCGFYKAIKEHLSKKN